MKLKSVEIVIALEYALLKIHDFNNLITELQ
jgi:hypothetical protein